VLHRLLGEATGGAEAGVGERGVESPERVEGGAHQRLLVVPLGHVAAHRHGVLVAAQLVRQGGQLVLRARGQHEAPPGLGCVSS